jgi:spore coat protein A, manganese oxidase
MDSKSQPTAAGRSTTTARPEELVTLTSATRLALLSRAVSIAVLLGGSQAAFAATTFTVTWNPPGPIGTPVNTNFTVNPVVTETGTIASTGTTTLASTLPTGVAFVSGGGGTTGFTCNYATATRIITCTRSTSISANAPVSVPWTLKSTTTGTKSIVASVSGGGSGAPVNSAALSVVVSAAVNPDLAVSVRQPSPALMATNMSQAEVRVDSLGSVASAPIKVTFNLPANISAPLKFSRRAEHWQCTTAGQVVSCTLDLPLAANTNTRLRIPVTPAVAGTLATPFSASVAAATNETNLANNGPVTMTPAAVVKRVVPAGLAVPGYSVNVLDPLAIPKYALPLPNVNSAFYKHTPDTTTVPGADSYKLDIKQVKMQMLPPGYPATNVFAYGDPARPETFSAPAHTIEARSTALGNTSGLGKPVKVQYLNTLATTTHLLPVDHTIHGANAGEPDIRSVGHLHGNKVVNESSDGYPEAWFSPMIPHTGPAMTVPSVLFNPNPFDYSNQQEATMMWYHDHTMAMTRLNVYAGLAGLYMLRDDNEMAMLNGNTLPSGQYEVPLVFQDRMFKTDGSLAYPDSVQIGNDPITNAPIIVGNAQNPSMVPEFFGDVMVVNGVTWPYLQVEPRKYRFRILNASNARFYTIALRNNGTTTDLPFSVIGTEGGFLDKPQAVTLLTMGPAERYDIVMDFSGLTGRNITVRNTAAAPFGRTVACPVGAPATCVPPGAAPVAGLHDQLMVFRVNLPFTQAVPNATIAATTALRTPVQPLPATAPVRQVVLGETNDNLGRILPILATPKLGYKRWMDTPISETPKANTVETWEIFNTSMDGHPVHLHDSAFQVLERQNFSAIFEADPVTGLANGKISNICYSATPQTAGNPACPPGAAPIKAALNTEKGWKETVIAYPSENNIPPVPGGIVQGQVTRVRVKFEGAGQFVWHCHITEHEDNDMMRPMSVLP